MCNILWLKPGAMPKEDDFENMVYNNWHGFGLVLRDENGKLQIIKDNPEENDPDEIYTLIDKHRDIERYLHVRHNTAGSNDLANSHPFDVISTNKGQLLFMHNGTMGEYDPKFISDVNHKARKDQWSDTRYFVESFLTPYCESLKNPLDIWNPAFRKVMARFWPSGNKGLLITNKGAATLGPWETLKGIKDVDIPSSNTTYFRDVTRGPEFDRRESAKRFAESERRKAEEAKAKEAGVGSNIIPFEGVLKHLRSDHFTKVYGTTLFLEEARDNPDLYNYENLAKLSCATAVELEQLVERLGDDLVPWLMYLTEALGRMNDERDEFERKYSAGTRLFATLKRYDPGLPSSVKEAEAAIALKEIPWVEDVKVG